MSQKTPGATRAVAEPASTRPIGRTGLAATPLGFGAARVFGDGLDLDPISTDTAVATVHAALDAGVRYIDTAPLYGDSEQLVGRALRSHPHGSEVVVATKVAHPDKGFDFSARATVASLRTSARQLGLECIHIAQIHEIHEAAFELVFRPGGTLDGLREAQAEGLIGHIGVTGGSDERAVVRALETGAFETVLIWLATDLLNDGLLRRVTPLAEKLGVAVIAGSPYAAGALSGDRDVSGRRVGADLYLERFGHPLDERIRPIERLCAKHQVDLGAAALQFTLRNSAVVTTVPGAYSVSQVVDNVERMKAVISEDFWRDLDALRREWPDDVAS